MSSYLFICLRKKEHGILKFFLISNNDFDDVVVFKILVESGGKLRFSKDLSSNNHPNMKEEKHLCVNLAQHVHSPALTNSKKKILGSQQEVVQIFIGIPKFLK